MAAPDKLVSAGTLSARDIVDETNLIVSGVTITPTREKREYRGEGGATKALQYRNPLLKFDFTSRISVEAGLAIAGPGSEIASLLNFASLLHTFDPAVVTMVFEDPVRDLSESEAPGLKFTGMHYPYVT